MSDTYTILLAAFIPIALVAGLIAYLGARLIISQKTRKD